MTQKWMNFQPGASRKVTKKKEAATRQSSGTGAGWSPPLAARRLAPTWLNYLVKAVRMRATGQAQSTTKQPAAKKPNGGP
jgi:hypothetical protein